MTRYRLYTDGSSHARGGKPGGWAWVLVEVKGDGVRESITATVYKAASGGEAETSNNRMEMTAILRGLTYIYENLPEHSDVEVCSDSQYALNMAGGTWNASSNEDLVRALRDLVAAMCQRGAILKFSWVRGHNGEPWNELVDRMATSAKERIVKSLDKTHES